MDDRKIIIRETVDGSPSSDARPQKREQTSSGARRQSAAGAKSVTKQKGDPYIWGIYLLILVFSVIELFSASSSEVKADNIYGPLVRHCLFLGIGLMMVIALQKIHYVFFSRFAWFLGVLSFGLLLIASFFGTEINGAQRAINIAGFTIQPPEIIKLTVVLLLSSILGKNQQPGGVTTSGVIQAALVVVVISAVLWINGLTNMILLMGISLSMFLIGNIQWRKLAVVLAVYALCGGVLVALKYQKSGESEFQQAVETSSGIASSASENEIGRQKTHMGRLESYRKGVKPTDTVTDANRQVFFALMAQAHGGLIGKGPGNSRESARLPLAFSDYIYSIVVEDSGFVGGTLLLVLYLCLLGRAGRIAYGCRRAVPAFLIMGCAVLIVFQALVHMAIVTGVAPVSGQPLPLISKGGTSVLVMSCAIGIMLSVSRFAVSKDTKETKTDISQLPEDMQALNATQG